MAQWQVALRCRLLARQCDNRADLFGRECRRGAGARCISQTLSDRRVAVLCWRYAFRRATPATLPMPNRLRPNAELTRDVANAAARRGQQDHPGTLRQLPWRRMRAHQAGQHLLLGGGGHNRFGRQKRHGNLANRETIHRSAMTHRGPLDSPRQTAQRQPTRYLSRMWQSGLTPRPWSRYLRRAAVAASRWYASLTDATGKTTRYHGDVAQTFEKIGGKWKLKVA